MKRQILIMIAFAFAFSSCNDSKKEYADANDVKASLVQEWFPYSGYAGEVMAVYETAQVNDLEIELQQGSDNIDPLKLVISGQSDFGVASADRILQANEKGAELVVIGVINYKSPTCFLSKEGTNLETPKDFENKAVGILTGTNTELIYRILKSKFSLNSIEEVEIPFDLATFISDTYEIRPAFAYDETVSLDLKNVSYNILRPEDFGVDFIGTVYFTQKETIKEKPELVKRFVKSIKEGWELALKNPEKAIKYLKVYDPTIDVKREMISLEKGLEYFEGEKKQTLFASKERWENMASDLIALGFIETFDFKKTINYNFLNINK